jgi:hypothetical protein
MSWNHSNSLIVRKYLFFVEFAAVVECDGDPTLLSLN